jgi:hypothetical protein
MRTLAKILMQKLAHRKQSDFMQPIGRKNEALSPSDRGMQAQQAAGQAVQSLPVIKKPIRKMAYNLGLSVGRKST